jgi:hypothetical protein
VAAEVMVDKDIVSSGFPLCSPHRLRGLVLVLLHVKWVCLCVDK